jgi:uncharacterized protein YbjT (DUF2867 family)
MRIAIAGGTGWLGRLVAEVVLADGDTPVVLARSAGIDLTTGQGLDQALSGATAVIDVSNITTTSRKKAVGFFEAATTHLLAAGQRAGIAHHIALSVVGADRIDLGYYIGKRHQEELVLNGPVPATVVRATHFHEFAAQMLARQGPLVVVPTILCEPIAAREVATALAGLVRAEPAGLATDLAGPRPESMASMIRRLAKIRATHRPVLHVRLPGPAGNALAHGALLPAGQATRGHLTFAEWLETDDANAPRPQ